MSWGVSTKADDVCTYCGEWAPYGGEHVLATDKIIIQHQRIELPGCDPVKVDIVKQGDILQSISSPSFIEFKIVGSLQCQQPLTDTQSELMVRLDFDELRDKDAMLAVSIGHHTNSNRIGFKSERRWSALRNRSIACGDGSGLMSGICQSYMRIEADEKFNQAWGRLLSFTTQDSRSSYQNQQQLWVEATQKDCELRHGNQGAPVWANYHTSSCVNSARNQRIKDMASIANCLQNQLYECSKLPTQPYVEFAD